MYINLKYQYVYMLVNINGIFDKKILMVYFVIINVNVNGTNMN